MYGLVFALLVLVIAGIYYHYNPQEAKEGFTSVTENPIKDNPQLGKIHIPPESPA
jgi:uncharacterized protein YjeT (DUF2065 family)